MGKKRISLSISEETFNELETFRKVDINGKTLTKERSEVYEEALIYGAEIMKKQDEVKKKISENINIDNIKLDNIR